LYAPPLVNNGYSIAHLLPIGPGQSSPGKLVFAWRASLRLARQQTGQLASLGQSWPEEEAPRVLAASGASLSAAQSVIIFNLAARALSGCPLETRRAGNLGRRLSVALISGRPAGRSLEARFAWARPKLLPALFTGRAGRAGRAGQARQSARRAASSRADAFRSTGELAGPLPIGKSPARWPPAGPWLFQLDLSASSPANSPGPLNLWRPSSGPWLEQRLQFFSLKPH